MRIDAVGPTDNESVARSDGRSLLVDLGLTTALLVALMAVVYRSFFQYGKSLVYASDGVAQHYPALYFLNDWLRGIAHDPQGGVPLWSWNIGLGADIVTSLSYYVVGDPFTLVSLAFPMHALEYAFALMYALRALAAALASVLYFRKLGAKPLPAAMGSIVYTFTAFLLWAALHHPMFFNAAVFLPLLLIGVENVLAHRRGWTLTAFALLAAVGNFYFFYLLTIVTAIYAVARWYQLAEKDRGWRGFLHEGLRFAGYYGAGVLLAAPVLLPTAAAVLQTARAEEYYRVTLFYGQQWYRTMLAALSSSTVGTYATTQGTYLGFAYLGLVLLPVLFLRRARYRALAFLVAAFAVFAALPVFGMVFNGFSYPSDRFAFSWAIFIAAASALMLSDDDPFERRELRAMLIGYAVYVLLVTACSSPLTPAVLLPMAIGALTIGVFWWEARGADRPRVPSVLPERWRSPSTRWVVLALLIANIAINGMTMFDMRYSKVLEPYASAGTVRGLYRTGPTKALKELPGGVYRVDNAHTGQDRRTWKYYNASLVQKYMGTSSYLSVISGLLSEFNAEIGSRTGWSSFSYDGFDDRVVPTTLMGVEYFTMRDGEEAFVPFGFMPYGAPKDTAVAFRNHNALPLGFVYTHAIDRSAYERLDAVDKPSAMLLGAVVDDGAAGELPRANPTPRAVDVSYTVLPAWGATFDERAGTIVRTESDAHVDLALEPVSDAELYVDMQGISNVIHSPQEQDAEKLGPNASWLDRAKLAYRYRDWHQPAETELYFSASDGPSKRAALRNPADSGEREKPPRLVNLGYQRRGASQITIGVPGAGTLSFESLRIRALPMHGFARQVAELKANAMTDIELGTNSVSGKVATPRPGVLFLSIPYSRGWTASVDGEPVETLRVNTAFTGVPVSAGEHEVELRYRTPWLVPGLLIALGSAMAFAFVRLVRRKRLPREQ